MNTQKINEDMLLYYDPSQPNRPAGWRPDPLYARLVERVNGAFYFKVGETSTFDMFFMHHKATLPTIFAVGIGSDWMVRVRAASLALAAANAKVSGPEHASRMGFSVGIEVLLSVFDHCI